jgi:hypothetical protein
VSNSFRTATGRCLIDDETLRIERADRGWLANPRDALTSDEVPPWRKAAVIGVFVAVLTGLGLLVRVAPPWLAGAVVGLLLAAVGWSAGANLAALAAVTANEPGFEPEVFPGISSDLQAVVGYAGVYDFEWWDADE